MCSFQISTRAAHHPCTDHQQGPAGLQRLDEHSSRVALPRSCSSTNCDDSRCKGDQHLALLRRLEQFTHIIQGQSLNPLTRPQVLCLSLPSLTWDQASSHTRLLWCQRSSLCPSLQGSRLLLLPLLEAPMLPAGPTRPDMASSRKCPFILQSPTTLPSGRHDHVMSSTEAIRYRYSSFIWSSLRQTLFLFCSPSPACDIQQVSINFF